MTALFRAGRRLLDASSGLKAGSAHTSKKEFHMGKFLWYMGPSGMKGGIPFTLLGVFSVYGVYVNARVAKKFHRSGNKPDHASEGFGH